MTTRMTTTSEAWPGLGAARSSRIGTHSHSAFGLWMLSLRWAAQIHQSSWLRASFEEAVQCPSFAIRWSASLLSHDGEGTSLRQNQRIIIRVLIVTGWFGVRFPSLCRFETGITGYRRRDAPRERTFRNLSDSISSNCNESESRILPWMTLKMSKSRTCCHHPHARTPTARSVSFIAL
jgi:hypothetical protein